MRLRSSSTFFQKTDLYLTSPNSCQVIGNKVYVSNICLDKRPELFIYYCLEIPVYQGDHITKVLKCKPTERYLVSTPAEDHFSAKLCWKFFGGKPNNLRRGYRCADTDGKLLTLFKAHETNKVHMIQQHILRHTKRACHQALGKMHFFSSENIFLVCGEYSIKVWERL